VEEAKLEECEDEEDASSPKKEPAFRAGDGLFRVKAKARASGA